MPPPHSRRRTGGTGTAAVDAASEVMAPNGHPGHPKRQVTVDDTDPLDNIRLSPDTGNEVAHKTREAPAAGTVLAPSGEASATHARLRPPPVETNTGGDVVGPPEQTQGLVQRWRGTQSVHDLRTHEAHRFGNVTDVLDDSARDGYTRALAGDKGDERGESVWAERRKVRIALLRQCKHSMTKIIHMYDTIIAWLSCSCKGTHMTTMMQHASCVLVGVFVHVMFVYMHTHINVCNHVLCKNAVRARTHNTGVQLRYVPQAVQQVCLGADAAVHVPCICASLLCLRVCRRVCVQVLVHRYWVLGDTMIHARSHDITMAVNIPCDYAGAENAALPVQKMSRLLLRGAQMYVCIRICMSNVYTYIHTCYVYKHA